MRYRENLMKAATHHVTPLWVYLAVFGGLCLLTLATVGQSLVLGALQPAPDPWGDGGGHSFLTNLSIALALAIATVKAGLVALFFMHLLHGERFNLAALLGSLFFVVIFFGLTLIDPLTRGQFNPEEAHPLAPQMNRIGARFQHPASEDPAEPEPAATELPPETAPVL